MSRKKYVPALLIVALCFASKNVSATDVELPDWFSDADSMTRVINGMGSEFDGDIAWLQLWKSSLEAQLIELDKRTSERRQAYECVRAAFSDLDSAINSCNQSVAERNATIASLENQVSTLESIIASLTSDRNSLAKQIADLHAAYATLLELSGERVDEILAQVDDLKARYRAMKLERDIFRNTLSNFYTRLGAHNYDAKAEGLALGQELCGEDFSFNTEA